VISRARELIATEGLGTFSLRRLAETLGVAPNALYNHVADRHDLLDAVTERVVADIRLPDGDEPWPDWVRAVATGLRCQLVARPGLTELVLARAGATAAGPQLLSGFLDRLQVAGLHRAVAHVAWHAMLTVVVGSLSQDRARDPDGDPTFDAVLEVTLTGLLTTAGYPPTAQARSLLDAHALP
jgi:AcrR family transcriptional regulator